MQKFDRPSIQHWYPSLKQLTQGPDSDLNPIIQETGSLTRLLDQRCGGIGVRPLSQRWGMMTRDEQQALQLPPRSRCFIREVHLYCRSDIWVQARTVIPVTTLTGKRRRLLHLGKRSLGEFLFSYPGMQRSTLEYSQFLPQHPLLKRFIKLDRGPVYARRGVYYLDGFPLLVMEIFLPQLFS